MVFGDFRSSASKVLLRKVACIDDEQHLSFLDLDAIPELYTISIEPDQFNTQQLQVRYDAHTHRLTIKLPDWPTVTFVLRSDHVMVLAEGAFDAGRFRADLQKALRAVAISR